MRYKIRDVELGLTMTREARGVSELMFDYLPWQTLDITVYFAADVGWTVIDNQTDFRYEITAA